MDLLTRVFIMIAKQKGVATLLALSLILGAFGVGLFFQHATKHVDHPVEQHAEDVLSDYNIDVDFSADKKRDKNDWASFALATVNK